VPQLATVTWVGDPTKERPLRGVHGIAGVTGGTLPAQIWHTYMTAALQGQPVEQFASPGSPPYKPWCGRYQFARTFRDARKHDGTCKKKQSTTNKKTTTRKTTTNKTTTNKTTTNHGTIHSTTITAPGTTAPPPTTTAPPPTTTAPPPTTTAPPPTTTAPPPPTTTTTTTSGTVP
jgi:membrane carboxypeptidase/penicillin-binding protein